MNLLWMGLALAAVALGVVLMLRRPTASVAPTPVARPTTPSPSAKEGTTAPASPALPVPSELADERGGRLALQAGELAATMQRLQAASRP
ncbi:MAG: hypothetical protein JNM08_15325 [Rubrivivax sp.]|nr:hypothetical protein [Rubrivivax sp.]